MQINTQKGQEATEDENVKKIALTITPSVDLSDSCISVVMDVRWGFRQAGLTSETAENKLYL